MLQRLWAYLNPIGSAQADTLTQGPNPLNNPSPVDPRLAGGGPPVPPGMLGGGQPPAPMPPGAPLPPIPGGPGGSSGGAGASAAIGPSFLPQARGVANPPFPGDNPTPWFTPSNTPYAPNPAVGAPLPPVRPKGPAVAKGSNRPAVKIPSSATASVPPASKSPFVPVAAQNQDWSGGALSRYGTSGFGRQGTALDLSSLFGRR